MAPEYIDLHMGFAMSGIGNDYTIGKKELRAEFKDARKAGYDYMVHYRQRGIDPVSTSQFGVECLANVESTLAFMSRHNTAERRNTIARLSASASASVIHIYDLSKSFSDAKSDVRLESFGFIDDAKPLSPQFLDLESPI